MTVDELIEELNTLSGSDEIQIGGSEGGPIIGVEWCDEFGAAYIYCE